MQRFRTRIFGKEMSSDAVVANRATLKSELEICSKKLQVGDKVYYVDLKENKRGRFIKLVESNNVGRMNRIIVPIGMVAEFLAILEKVNEYIKENPHDSTVKTDETSEFPLICFTQQLFMMGRRFYFDLRIHKEGARRLRISYVNRSRRINFSIADAALVSVVEILADYLTESADYLATEVLSNDGGVHGDHKSGLKSGFRPSGNSASKGFGRDDRPAFKKTSLVVCEKPTPLQQSVLNKSYTLELVVGGNNSFIRMTEHIGNTKKSTVHVPLEGCVAWKDAVNKFVGQITPDDIAKATSLRLAAEAAAAVPANGVSLDV